MAINGSNILNRIVGAINSNITNYGRSIARLSSGNRLVRTSDEPSSFIISEQLANDISGINQAIKNTETDISLLQTADAAIEEISSLLHYLKQDALISANSAASDPIIQQLNQKDASVILDTIDRIVNETKFGNKKILDGSAGAQGAAIGEFLEFISGNENSKETSGKGNLVTIEQRGTQSYWLGRDILNEINLEPGSKLQAIENGKVAEYEVTWDDNVDTTLINFQRAIDSADLDLVVDTNPAGRLLIYHRQYGSNYGFEVSSTINGVLSNNIDELESSIPGFDAVGSVNDEYLIGDGQILKGRPGTDTEGIVLKYTYDNRNLSNPAPIDYNAGYYTLKQNSSYFQTFPNVGGGFRFSLENLSTNNLGKLSNIDYQLIDNSEYDVNFQNLSEIDISTTNGALASLNVINAASDQILQARSKIASIQKHNLEATFNYLLNTKENIQSAISTIKDVDYAKEIINAVNAQMNISYAGMAFNKTVQLQDNVRKLLDTNIVNTTKL